MATRIKTMAVWKNGQKIGRAENVSLKLITNDQSEVSLDGYVGHTFGVRLSQGSIDIVIAEDGKNTDLTDAVIAGTPLNFTFSHGNRLLALEGRLIDADLSSEVKSGTQKGKYTLEGGAPNIIG